MSVQHFRLTAEVRTANRSNVRAALSNLLPGARIDETELGFELDAQMDGESARELNRQLLSSLRRIERRTTLRAAWTSALTTERFFDYVSKGIHPAAAPDHASPANHGS